MNNSEREKARDMFVIGHSLSEIAARFNVSLSTVSGICARDDWTALRQLHRRKLGLDLNELKQNAKAS
jgi:uncharacterized protein YjcR